MKLRVLEVLASLRRAGAERVAVSLACGLDPARFKAGVISLYDPFAGGFESELAEHNVPMWRLGKRPGLDPRMWPRLARVFREFRPDIVHTHSYVLRYVLPAHALRRTGTIVHSVHNLAAQEVDAAGRAIHRLAFRAGVVPVAVSEEVARSFRNVYGFEPAVIPNGIDTRRRIPAVAREEWRKSHGFQPSDVLIVSVARFEPQKNPIGLIRAFARANSAEPASHLIMAGEGSLLEASRHLAQQLGLAGRVHFPGVCRSVPELLAACDLFALASNWEGSPVAILEAMAAGLPVLATAVGGVPELVLKDVTGVLVPPGDMEALARAMTALARDPARRQAMGEAGAKRAARFDAGEMIQSYARLFERLRGRA